MIALRKLKDNKGLTLTELLCAIIVMLLVTAVMVVGIRLGTQAYVKSVSMSEAQQLCSTITTLVNDELRFARQISVANDEANTVSIFSKNFGKDSGTLRSYGQNEDGQVVLGGTKILSSTSYPHNLKAKVNLSYAKPVDTSSRGFANGVFTATVEIYRTEGAVLATTTFQVQPLNHVTVSGL